NTLTRIATDPLERRGDPWHGRAVISGDRGRGTAQRRRRADQGRGVGDALADRVDEIPFDLRRVEGGDQPRRGGFPRRDAAVITQFHEHGSTTSMYCSGTPRVRSGSNNGRSWVS